MFVFLVNNTIQNLIHYRFLKNKYYIIFSGN